MKQKVKRGVLRQERRKSALERLQTTLKVGYKKGKDNKEIILSEKDIKRIKQEIITLKQRIV